ncbi:MAG: 1,4-dihydroxy-6-naphthoate synthase [Saprospiraceae bacterium]
MSPKVKINLAISPCPNDTFIFGAWINAFLDNEKLSPPNCDFLDIEELNQAAKSGQYDLIKVSAAHAFSLLDKYDILSCGGAVGENCGPLLISTKQNQNKNPILSSVALPGIQTTAHLLYNFAYPNSVDKKFMLFSKIEDDVLQGRSDFGVIIHENRFTYKEKGLVLIKDLGVHWQDNTNLPIPLGLILVKKGLPMEIKSLIKSIIQESIKFAQKHLHLLLPFIKSHSQDLHEEVILQHIKLYVNSYSLDLAESGKMALEKLFQLSSNSESTPQFQLI